MGTFKAWGLGIDSNGATDWTAPFFITVASGPGSPAAGSAFPVDADAARAGIVRSAVWWRRRYPQSTPYWPSS